MSLPNGISSATILIHPSGCSPNHLRRHINLIAFHGCIPCLAQNCRSCVTCILPASQPRLQTPPRAGFVSLGTADVLSSFNLCRRAVPSVAGCVAARLASTHWMPGAPHPQLRQQKCLHVLLHAPGGKITPSSSAHSLGLCSHGESLT